MYGGGALRNDPTKGKHFTGQRFEVPTLAAALAAFDPMTLLKVSRNHDILTRLVLGLNQRGVKETRRRVNVVPVFSCNDCNYEVQLAQKAGARTASLCRVQCR